MASRIIAILATACGASAPAPAPHSVPGIPTSTLGRLETTYIFDTGRAQILVSGNHVDLETLPLADWIGLPMSGYATVAIDLAVPVVAGRRDWSKATGDVRLECTVCRLGNDRAKLRVATSSRAAAAMAPDGIEVGHIELASVAIALHVGDGHAAITRWQISSPDVAFDASLDVELASDFEDSKLEGCLRFKPTEALGARDSRTFAAIVTTGAELAPTGRFEIRLAGTVGDMRRLAQVCDGSEPLKSVESVNPPERPSLVPPPTPSTTATPADIEADADAIKAVDGTHVDVDAALLAKVIMNPMPVAKTLRIVPSIANGKPDGYKLYSIRPGSIAARLGLVNGDTVHAVAGIALDSVETALNAFIAVSALHAGESFDVALTRHGKPLSITYRVR